MDPEAAIAQAFLDFALRPVGKLCRCELLRHQLVGYLYRVYVPPIMPPDPDPDCPFCFVVDWALSQVLDDAALEFLESELEQNNPLAVAIWDCAANPSGVGLE
jgi:hypothetical protein